MCCFYWKPEAYILTFDFGPSLQLCHWRGIHQRTDHPLSMFFTCKEKFSVYTFSLQFCNANACS